MDWLWILLIFVFLVLLVWFLMARQVDESDSGHPEHAEPAHAGADDLTKIEGIGPKVAELLKSNGIGTFAALAKADVAQVDKILDAAGSIYRAMDASSWPKQAALAAAGDWDGLKKLQEDLVGGR